MTPATQNSFRRHSYVGSSLRPLTLVQGEGVPPQKSPHRLSFYHPNDPRSLNHKHYLRTAPSLPNLQYGRPSQLGSPSAISTMPIVRYYFQALTPEDRVALGEGQFNHNLREWTGEDVLKYSAASRDLHCHLPEKQQPVSRSSDPVNISRSASADSIVSRFSFRSLIQRSEKMQRPKPTPVQGFHVLEAPLRKRSPLSAEVSPRRANFGVTFDDFLAKHESGKGEAYRGSENAEKTKEEKKAIQKQKRQEQRERLKARLSMPELKVSMSIMWPNRN